MPFRATLSLVVLYFIIIRMDAGVSALCVRICSSALVRDASNNICDSLVSGDADVSHHTARCEDEIE